MLNIRKSQRGMTLVEVMASILIGAIVIIGAAQFFVTGRKQVNLQGHYRKAIHLAAQKIEELKSDNYDNIVAGEAEENLSLNDFSYGRRIMIENAGLYKKVGVTVNWSIADQHSQVSLATFIAPK